MAPPEPEVPQGRRATPAGGGPPREQLPSDPLFARLVRRTEVAVATGVVAEVFDVPPAVAATLLEAEAVRRELPLADLAAEVVLDPARVGAWRSSASCAVCGSSGRVRAFGGLDEVLVLVCPDGHGVIRRA